MKTAALVLFLAVAGCVLAFQCRLYCIMEPLAGVCRW